MTHCVVFGVWLLSLSIALLRSAHVIVCVSASPLSMAEEYSSAWMWHIVFIHWPVNGRLVIFTFWLLYIMLLRTGYTGVGVDTCFYLSCIYLGVEFLGHMIILQLAFWRTSRLFSTAPAPFYTPIHGARGFQLLHSLTCTCGCQLDYSHLSG